MDEYPNNGDALAESWAPEKPQERKQAEDKEREMIVTSVGAIKDVIEWFEHKSAEYLNPATISGVNYASKAEDVKKAVLFAQEMSSEFQSKAAEFRAKFKDYIKEEPADEA